MHQVTPDLAITVGRVTVGAQPAGAMLVAAADPELGPIIERGFVMVVDPGFFSMEWLTMKDGKLVPALCGTNMRAVSVILERTAELIWQAEASRPTLESLEKAVRTGAPTILVAGQNYDYQPMLTSAADDVCIPCSGSWSDRLPAGRFSNPEVPLCTGLTFRCSSRSLLEILVGLSVRTEHVATLLPPGH